MTAGGNSKKSSGGDGVGKPQKKTLQLGGHCTPRSDTVPVDTGKQLLIVSHGRKQMRRSSRTRGDEGN